ncbi:cytochrome C oxidase subunit II [Kouleothrix aurantiaca]|uniref:Cytochrome c oxidase subunit 2 n=1 Tax=Kouleothrix aurantiaca TaxID=186479 RepID=A0A0N8PSA5_9CHLR|nr:cytochrome C oxidase subunit II [Kouleothrix aurantiaca]
MRARRPSLRLPVIATLSLAGAALLLSACGQVLPASTLHPNGDYAQRVYDLMIPVFWAALGVFVVVESILIYSVLRFRQRSENDPIPAQIHGNTRIEIMWTIAPALILLVIAVLSFRTQAVNATQPADAMQIKVVGHQWWWEFQYEDKKIVTANDVYIPVGKPVQFKMTSVDVIHDPWVPRLSGKTDAIPGTNNVNYISFTPQEPGIYRGLCAEFCGEEHAVMRFRVIAVPQEVFDSWVQQHQQPVGPTFQAAAADPARLGPGDPARGEKAFLNTKNLCITCHAISGYKEAVGVTGPNLTYFGNRETIGAGALPNTPENLSRWIHNPGEVKPGNIMSTVIKPGTVSDQDIADIVAFLESQTISIEKPAER